MKKTECLNFEQKFQDLAQNNTDSKKEYIDISAPIRRQGATPKGGRACTRISPVI
jgi:hypothetical protein